MRTLRLAIAFALCASVAPVSAQAISKNYELNIPRQSLETALKEFAQQTGLQVARFADTVDGSAIVGPVNGEYSTDEALKSLLESSGLTYKVVNDRTIAITRSDETERKPEPGKETTTVGVKKNDVTRLAQTDIGPQSSAQDQPTTTVQLGEVTVTIPEVLVVGTRSINADIQRTEDDPQPYVVFDRAQIERSMSTNLEDFLKTRLPMNTVQGTLSQSTGSTLGNQSSISLRGLGANQTLILVDGRRMPGISNTGSFSQPDINGIPLASIERIEVLPSTASGIYGGGATGGVVNIITRKDYSGLDVQASYGNTFESDAASRRIDAGVGFRLEDGRTHVMISASHAEADPLLNGEREFVARGRALQFANNPNAFFNLTTPPLGYTSNIRSQDGSNLVLDNNTPLNSPRTFVPLGYEGPASDGGAALVANAGQYNLNLPESLNGATQSLLNNPTADAVSLNVRRTFATRVEAFVDVFWLDNQGQSFLANLNVPSTVTLAAAAPNNPFTTAITVSFPATGISFPLESDSETLRAAGGVILRLPRDWTAAADYVWSRSRSSSFFTNPATGDPDGLGPGVPADTALASGTLDVMRDLNALPLDWSPYLLLSPNQIYGPADTLLKGATVRLSGPLFQLPGGPFTVSGLAERREEEAEDTFRDQMSSSAVTSAVFWPSRSQRVDSSYLEARAPLISDANALRFMRALELQASVRRDDYQTRAPSPASPTVSSRTGPLPALTHRTNDVSSTDYTFGLLVSPAKDLVLRASFGTGFLPPDISQIVPSPSVPLTQTLTDPKRGGVSATTGPFTQVSGGNPNLIPEDSESWSAGVIFTPRALPGLRLSVDYTHIEKLNEIRFLNNQAILDLEDSLTGRVTRDPLTPADAALGYTGGVITAFDTTLVNIAAADLEAYDMQVDYSLQTDRAGEFHFYAIATWQRHFERQTVPTAPFVDSVGFTSGPLEWRGNAGMTWKRGPWTLDWNLQYYDSYFTYAATAIAAQAATATLNQGSAEIPSQIYHDLLIRYRIDGSKVLRGALENTEFLLGIQNVLDESPPILATTGANNAYSTYGDPRLRHYSLTVRKSFR